MHRFLFLLFLLFSFVSSQGSPQHTGDAGWEDWSSDAGNSGWHEWSSATADASNWQGWSSAAANSCPSIQVQTVTVTNTLLSADLTLTTTLPASTVTVTSGQNTVVETTTSTVLTTSILTSHCETGGGNGKTVTLPATQTETVTVTQATGTPLCGGGSTYNTYITTNINNIATTVTTTITAATATVTSTIYPPPSTVTPNSPSTPTVYLPGQCLNSTSNQYSYNGSDIVTNVLTGLIGWLDTTYIMQIDNHVNNSLTQYFNESLAVSLNESLSKILVTDIEESVDRSMYNYFATNLTNSLEEFISDNVTTDVNGALALYFESHNITAHVPSSELQDLTCSATVRSEAIPWWAILLIVLLILLIILIMIIIIWMLCLKRSEDSEDYSEASYAHAEKTSTHDCPPDTAVTNNENSGYAQNESSNIGAIGAAGAAGAAGAVGVGAAQSPPTTSAYGQTRADSEDMRGGQQYSNISAPTNTYANFSTSNNMYSNVSTSNNMYSNFVNGHSFPTTPMSGRAGGEMVGYQSIPRARASTTCTCTPVKRPFVDGLWVGASSTCSCGRGVSRHKKRYSAEGWTRASMSGPSGQAFLHNHSRQSSSTTTTSGCTEELFGNEQSTPKASMPRRPEMTVTLDDATRDQYSKKRKSNYDEEKVAKRLSQRRSSQTQTPVYGSGALEKRTSRSANNSSGMIEARPSSSRVTVVPAGGFRSQNNDKITDGTQATQQDTDGFVSDQSKNVFISDGSAQQQQERQAMTRSESHYSEFTSAVDTSTQEQHSSTENESGGAEMAATGGRERQGLTVTNTANLSREPSFGTQLRQALESYTSDGGEESTVQRSITQQSSSSEIERSTTQQSSRSEAYDIEEEMLASDAMQKSSANRMFELEKEILDLEKRQYPVVSASSQKKEVLADAYSVQSSTSDEGESENELREMTSTATESTPRHTTIMTPNNRSMGYAHNRHSRGESLVYEVSDEKEMLRGYHSRGSSGAYSVNNDDISAADRRYIKSFLGAGGSDYDLGLLMSSSPSSPRVREYSTTFETGMDQGLLSGGRQTQGGYSTSYRSQQWVQEQKSSSRVNVNESRTGREWTDR